MTSNKKVHQIIKSLQKEKEKIKFLRNNNKKKINNNNNRKKKNRINKMINNK